MMRKILKLTSFANIRGGITQVNVNRSPGGIKVPQPPHCSTEILFSITAILNLKEQLSLKDFNQPKL